MDLDDNGIGLTLIFAAASYRIFQRFCTLNQLIESLQHRVFPYVLTDR